MKRGVDANGHLDRLARNAAAYDLIESLVRRLSALPIRTRRRTLQLAIAVLWVFTKRRADPRLAAILRRVLSLPRASSVPMAKRVIYHSVLYQLECLAVINRTAKDLLRDGRFISSSSDCELKWVAQQRGAVLATMHFGPYPLGLAWLLHHYFQGKQVVIVKSNDSSPDEQRALMRLAELGVDTHVMAPESPKEFHRILKFVRNGGVAIIMVDLPPSYGKSSRADILSMPVRLADGAVDLAAICHVPMTLFRVRNVGLRDVVEVEAVIDVDRDDSASLLKAKSRVNRMITETVRDYPEQWHMWPLFDQYLLQPQSVK